jgi:hypothetical protein
MKDKLHTPDQLHSRTARIGAGVIGLILAYATVTRAFDTGSLWQYFIAVLLLILSVRLIIRGVKKK